VKRIELFIRKSLFAADGSVDVLSKLTTVKECHAAIDKRSQSRIDKAGSVDAAPHRADAAENRRPPRINKVVKQWVSPSCGLRIQHSLYLSLNLVGIYSGNSGHRNPHCLRY